MTGALPHVAQMAPYALADLAPPHGKRLVSLSQNESLRPAAPEVTEAIQAGIGTCHFYPDPDWSEVREALADLHGLDASQILCGNGSLDLIGVLARAYLSPRHAALAPAHAYPFFRTATLMCGAWFDTAPEDNLTASVDALLDTVRSETRIVFVANPGNPTGTRIPKSELRRLRDGLPENTILVVDEAYGEFADHLKEQTFDMVSLGNTIVLRTFSKAYGLAGMRVGWGYFPASILLEMRKLMNPNNVAVFGQKAARAAVAAQGYMHDTCTQTARLRDDFKVRMRRAGLEVPESLTNFVLMRFPEEELAARVDARLKVEGVFLRPQGGAGLPDCLRATVGVADNMDFAASLLEDALQKEGLS